MDENQGEDMGVLAAFRALKNVSAIALLLAGTLMVGYAYGMSFWWPLPVLAEATILIISGIFLSVGVLNGGIWLVASYDKRQVAIALHREVLSLTDREKRLLANFVRANQPIFGISWKHHQQSVEAALVLQVRGVLMPFNRPEDGKDVLLPLVLEEKFRSIILEKFAATTICTDFIEKIKEDNAKSKELLP